MVILIVLLNTRLEKKETVFHLLIFHMLNHYGKTFLGSQELIWLFPNRLLGLKQLDGN
jgi:hypothetical protein